MFDLFQRLVKSLTRKIVIFSMTLFRWWIWHKKPVSHAKITQKEVKVFLFEKISRTFSNNVLQIWSLYYCTFSFFHYYLYFFKLWTRNRGNHNAQKCIKYINKISSNRLWILNTYPNKCAFSFLLYIFLILPKINWSVAIWNIMRF